MEKMTHRWDEAIETLGKCPKEKRDHFAMLIVRLAECYLEEPTSRAVILIDTEDSLLMFSAGADDMAATDIVNKAQEVLVDVVTYDAPPKEMFN
jgi:hypothetical protein